MHAQVTIGYTIEKCAYSKIQKIPHIFYVSRSTLQLLEDQSNFVDATITKPNNAQAQVPE